MCLLKTKMGLHYLLRDRKQMKYICITDKFYLKIKFKKIISKVIIILKFGSVFEKKIIINYTFRSLAYIIKIECVF